MEEVDEVVDEVEEVEVEVLVLFKTAREISSHIQVETTTHDEEVVLEVEDVGELPAEDLDDALDVLSFGVGGGLGLGPVGLGLESY